MADNYTTMNARDAIFASKASCYVTLNGERYLAMNLASFTATLTPNVVTVGILGRTTKGHKMAGAEGTFSGTMYYNTSIWRRCMYEYHKTGEFPYFEIQVTNEDPTSSVGLQTIILKDCLLSAAVLASFDVNTDVLTEDFNGTFDSWEMPQEFTLMEGMQ